MSDSSDQRVEAPELPFLSYPASGQPRGGDCTEPVDTSAPLIVNGFGFGAANNRNVASVIDSSNVHELVLNYRFAPANAVEKRGAPAVTSRGIALPTVTRATGQGAECDGEPFVSDSP